MDLHDSGEKYSIHKYLNMTKSRKYFEKSDLETLVNQLG